MSVRSLKLLSAYYITTNLNIKISPELLVNDCIIYLDNIYPMILQNDIQKDFQECCKYDLIDEVESILKSNRLSFEFILEELELNTYKTFKIIYENCIKGIPDEKKYAIQ